MDRNQYMVCQYLCALITVEPRHLSCNKGNSPCFLQAVVKAPKFFIRLNQSVNERCDYSKQQTLLHNSNITQIRYLCLQSFLFRFHWDRTHIHLGLLVWVGERIVRSSGKLLYKKKLKTFHSPYIFLGIGKIGLFQLKFKWNIHLSLNNDLN